MTKPDDEGVFTRAEYRYGTDGRCNVGVGFWQMAFGSKATLDAANFNAAYAAMGAFKDEAGEPLGVMPRPGGRPERSRARLRFISDSAGSPRRSSMRVAI